MRKPDFPPLLEKGLHPHSIQEVRDLCVPTFPLSTTRPRIMDGLEKVVEMMSGQRVHADIWIDGSFMTEKIDPEDADILIRMDNKTYDGGSRDQKALLSYITQEPNVHTDYLCDAYLHIDFPEGHKMHWYSMYMYAYWLKQYGFGHDEHSDMKGIAVISI